MSDNNELSLNVTKSLSGKIWVKPNYEEQRLATSLQQISSLPYPLALLLAQRGIQADQIDAYLNPKIKNDLPEPLSLNDMPKAVSILSRAVIEKKKIAIFADYDVDGGTSSALLHKWFMHFGLKTSIYIPDRVEEGYGPNNKAMEYLSENHDIIICVDCGTLSFDPINKAKSNGCQVIIVDHHLGGNKNPDADAIVNPNRIDELSKLKYLCAAGVVFLLLVGLNRQLKKEGHQVPELMYYLDLVALATIADVVPLLGLNRTYVKAGLTIIELRKNVGISALLDVSMVNGQVRSNHLGFALGPRINAGSRLGSSKLGADLLIENDIRKAEIIAKTLDSLNDDRKLIEAAMLEKALKLIEQKKSEENLTWVSHQNWNPGLTGILASRLQEKFGKPSVVIAIDSNGIGKGSGRSSSNFNLGNAVSQLLEEKLISKGGGHARAAGITLKSKQIQKAMERLSEILLVQSKMDTHQPRLNITSLISVKAATPNLIEKIETAGPFGASAPAPIFVMANCKIKWFKIVAEKHLRFTISDESNRTIQAIFFQALETKVGDFLNQNQYEKYHFAGYLEINDWSGQKYPNFVIQDAALAI